MFSIAFFDGTANAPTPYRLSTDHQRPPLAGGATLLDRSGMIRGAYAAGTEPCGAGRVE
ncbi:hypothetical protein [Albirhodobacter sp. R86504]|uniref:hypothetical protein n=1 Tax=Albirhodobacter sp. R86504 TaxID=3093848 RepID=UPI00366B4B5A